MRQAIVFMVLALLYTLGLGAVALLRRVHERAMRSRCANHFRMLGLAAIQYADDKRNYPHIRGAKELDGGVDTNDGPKAIGGLVRLGYADGYGLTCAATPDEPPPMLGAGPERPGPAPTAEERARWTFSGVPGDPDPILAETRHLSYGWTRRPLNSNSKSSRWILGDRAVLADGVERQEGDDPLQGNHAGVFMTGHADGTVFFEPLTNPEVARAAATELPDDMALGILDPMTPRPKPPLRWRWSGWSTPGLSLVPLGLLGLLAALSLRRREPPPPPGPGVRPVRASRIRELGPEERAIIAMGQGGTPPADEVTLQAGQRCPVCHGELEGKAEPLTACPGCRATFHAACVAPGAPCSTLGCEHGRRRT
jgi:hypothetical protein